MMQLSHVAIAYMKDEPMLEFFADPKDIRAEIFKFIENEGKVDDAIDGFEPRLQNQRIVYRC